jgi:hypothetical protein
MWQTRDEPEATNQKDDWKLIVEQRWIYKREDSQGFLLQNTVLNDHTMYEIVISIMIETDRNRYYSLNFTPKEYANSRAPSQKVVAKAFNKKIKIWHYAVICDNTQLHEQKEEEGRLVRTIASKRAVTAALYLGSVCLSQNSSSISVELRYSSTNSINDQSSFDFFFFDIESLETSRIISFTSVNSSRTVNQGSGLRNILTALESESASSTSWNWAKISDSLDSTTSFLSRQRELFEQDLLKISRSFRKTLDDFSVNKDEGRLKRSFDNFSESKIKRSRKEFSLLNDVSSIVKKRKINNKSESAWTLMITSTIENSHNVKFFEILTFLQFASASKSFITKSYETSCRLITRLIVDLSSVRTQGFLSAILCKAELMNITSFEEEISTKNNTIILLQVTAFYRAYLNQVNEAFKILHDVDDSRVRFFLKQWRVIARKVNEISKELIR